MLKFLLSMKMAVVVMFLFGIVIGAATFIENDYGTQTARALIYQATWFELLLFYFIVLVAYNMTRYKSYKQRLPVFLFHSAFLIIAIAAAITRYLGYEGIMHIREGEESSTMVSDVQVLQVRVAPQSSDAPPILWERPLYLSTMTSNDLDHTISVEEKKLRVELLEYQPNVQQVIIDDPNEGKSLVELVVSSGGMQGESIRLVRGESKELDEFVIAFDAEVKSPKPLLTITGATDALQLATPHPLSYLNMDDRTEGELESGMAPFVPRRLYRFGSNAIVLKSTHEHAKLVYQSMGLKSVSGRPDLLRLRLSMGDASKEVTLLGQKGLRGEVRKLMLANRSIALSYGAKLIALPFSLELVKFEMTRYPGSNTPSSYASEVILIDPEQKIREPFRIYMNHVLDHRGYRFFQSSFDRDEKGTILSVNHDPGTLPTYLGYLLLTIGMIWALIIPAGRFQKLLHQARRLQHGALALLGTLLLWGTSAPALAATPTADPKIMETITQYDPSHAAQFGSLIVQDFQGRMKPLNTMAVEIISKISGKSSILGLTPDQVLLGMVTKPDLYQDVRMVKIGHPKIALVLGLDTKTKFAKFSDLFDPQTNAYKLYADVTEASRKKPLEKSQYDKELEKIDERLNVVYMVFTGSLFKIFPKPYDPNYVWLSPVEAIEKIPGKEGQFVQLMTQSYFQSVSEALEDGIWTKANEALDVIAHYQQFHGDEVFPSEAKRDIEMLYNKLGIFGKLVSVYLLLAILLLGLAFIHVLKPKMRIGLFFRGAWILLMSAFVVHVVGMGMRWYVAGHEPWSNAYESIVFIAAATIFAGLLLAKHSPIALGAAALLTGITMAVAHMNFINPEITNLVPVLKSYWLMIHVATIISGDGFLGLGSVLSLFVLILFLLRKRADSSVDRSIKELTNLSEMSLIIGLILMTVGNFLGGVWANESWGRYWGWDPKETWAAVTILIYATVLHLRFVPALKSTYIYNVAAVWAYSSVLMTYFGVNYYLSGLHSYAAGDPIPFPTWAWYSIAVLAVLSLLAARHRKGI
jgi:cytochrome c-type biogenesis protein CcsB